MLPPDENEKTPCFLLDPESECNRRIDEGVVVLCTESEAGVRMAYGIAVAGSAELTQPDGRNLLMNSIARSDADTVLDAVFDAA